MKANEAREIVKKVWGKVNGDDDPSIGRVETFENGLIRAVVEDVVCEILDDGGHYVVLTDGGYLCTVSK